MKKTIENAAYDTLPSYMPNLSLFAVLTKNIISNSTNHSALQIVIQTFWAFAVSGSYISHPSHLIPRLKLRRKKLNALSRKRSVETV